MKNRKHILNQRGFSLVEAILTLVILAVGTFGVMSIFTSSVDKFNNSEQMSISSFLAQGKLEEMIAGKKSQGYVSITNVNYPANEDLAGLGYAGYTRTTTILEVDDADLTTASPSSGYKRITVSVTTPMNETYTFYTLVTNWE